MELTWHALMFLRILFYPRTENFLKWHFVFENKSKCPMTYLNVVLHNGSVSSGICKCLLSSDLVHFCSEWLIFQVPISKSASLAVFLQITCISIISTKYCFIFECIDSFSLGSATIFPESFCWQMYCNWWTVIHIG